METKKILLDYTIPDISDMVLDYAFKCDKDMEYFELGYYEKCKEIIGNNDFWTRFKELVYNSCYFSTYEEYKRPHPTTVLYHSCVGGVI